MNELHITNGDIFRKQLQKLAIAETPLPWRDVLHEGPVPGGLALRELSDIRARYIAEQHWGPAEQVRASFRSRDDRFLHALEEPARGGGDIILWFEDDLYDQLQLLQVLNEIAGHPPAAERVTLIQAQRNFQHFSDDEIRSALEERVSVTPAMLSAAHLLWRAFTDPTPEGLNSIAAESGGALPLAREALLRLIEEFPSKRNGLTKTEQWMLELLAEGHNTPSAIFREYQKREKRQYLGDLILGSYLARLSDRPAPLFEFTEEYDDDDPNKPILWQRRIRLTLQGELVVAGELHLLELRPIDRWLGGIRIQHSGGAWVYDAGARKIEQMAV